MDNRDNENLTPETEETKVTETAGSKPEEGAESAGENAGNEAQGGDSDGKPAGDSAEKSESGDEQAAENGDDGASGMGPEKLKKYMIIGTIALAVIMLIVLGIVYMSSRKGDKDKNKESGTEQTASAETASVSPTQSATSTPTATPTAEAATPTPTTAAASTDGFTADVFVENTWGDSPKYSQFKIVLKNNTDSGIDGWKLEMNVGEGAKIDNGWNGEYSINGGILTVTNAEYNGKIDAHATVEIGVIIAGVTGDLTYTLTSAGTYSSGSGSSGNSGDNGNSGNGGNSGGTPAANPGALDVPDPTTDDWLHVKNNKIYDESGKEVWLTGVNWFGYNTGTNTFDGLWTSDLNTSIQGIADHGFNLIRVPISAQLILQWKNGEAPDANFNNATNDYLVGMDSLEIFDYVVGQCRACGLKIMIDIHSAETDASGHNVNLWYTANISTAQYQEALCYMAERYKNDDTIIAFDLKNEPHGKPSEGSSAAIWNDSKSDNNWKYIAQETALKVLDINPNVLIMVEGTEIYPIDIKKNGDYSSSDSKDYYFNWWGGNLRGVADYPIDLGKYQDKLVYSPHDYGPTVYEQPWFEGSYNYDSLMSDCWHDNWFYIYEDKIAPLLIGEWGGYMTEPNITWMTHMRTLIGKYHLNHTFWCFNANSGDTGGLVLDDFTTWDEEKYEFVKEVLWQENGKFVGLDHEIPLGPSGNGISLSEAKGL